MSTARVDARRFIVLPVVFPPIILVS